MMLETTANVPKPLMNPYPLNAAIYFPDITRNHIYKEDSRDGRNWTISTGNSQVQVFEQVLQSMFTSSHQIANLKEVTDNCNLVLIPTIKDMQFALPSETGLEYYEVWIDYELSVVQPSGDAISVLPFSGYGRSKKGYFSQGNKGLQIAASQAFRDLAAKFMVSFIQDPEIRKWRLSNASSS